MKPITTTLNAIRSHQPCRDGWKKLMRYLKKTEADNEPLSLMTVLKSNGLDHAVWCLRALPESEHWRVRLFTVACAEQVKHLMTDERSLNALRVAEAYALGFASQIELDAAEGEAAEAVRITSRGDWGAPREAARAAAWAAALSARAWDWASEEAQSKKEAQSKRETLFKAYFGSPLPKEHYIEQYTKEES